MTATKSKPWDKMTFLDHWRVAWWCALRGGFYVCWRPPFCIGAQHVWYDGPHYCLYLGWLAFEISAPPARLRRDA